MKKRFMFVALLTMLVGLCSFNLASAQTFTLSYDCSDSDGYTCKPSTGDVTTSSGDKWIAATSSTPIVWIKAKAKLATTDGSNRVKFYAVKSSGTFNNDISIVIRKDVKISGGKVTNIGTIVGSNSAKSGTNTVSAQITLDFSAGSHTYTIILTSGAMTFYTRPITISSGTSSVPDLTISSNTYFSTTTLTKGKAAAFVAKVKNTGSTDWTGYFFVKPVDTNNNWIPSGNSSTLVTIKSSNEYTITGSYTPDKVGNYSVGIYYLTKGESSGDLVKKGSYQNPFNVVVKDASIANPTTPSSPTPANGATDVATTTKLSWGCAPNDGGSTLSFDLYLGESEDNMPYYGKGSGSDITIPNLKAGQIYYWKVVAWNGSGGSAPGPKWHFTTKKATTPSAPSLTITNNNYFGTSLLTKGKEATFVTQVKNTGSTDWTGSFFVKPVGTKDDWVAKENITIKSGSVYTIYDKYTPQEAGNYSIGVYYLTKGESSGDLVNKGSYQNPFNVTVTSSSGSLTEWADLKLNYLVGNAYGFPSNQLTVGQPEQYSVALKNNGDTDWKGTIYLKDEKNEVIRSWPFTKNSPLPGKGGAKLECYFTPKTAGSKTLTLYYQTDTHGDGRPVQSGTMSNPQSIKVIEVPTTYSGLKLKRAISCPTTLALGASGNLAASVTNSGSSSWTGFLYLTDNGAYVERKEVTISGNGGTQSITKSGWVPKTAGKHEISVVFKTSGADEDVLVNANGFTNPATVSVTNTVAAKKAKITLVTKGLAPTRVSPGTEVYYHFRITDEKGNRLSGVKAVFQYKLNSTLKSNNYLSPASDENGLITLCLKTDGDDAIATKGQTATLTCCGLQSSNGTNLDLYESTSDGYISLSVKNGRAFDNVESLKLEIEPGLKWGTKIENKIVDAKVGVEASFPISLRMDYNDDGEVEKYTEAVGVKVKGSGNIDVGYNEKLDNPNDWFSSFSASVSVGGDIEFSSEDFAGGMKCLALAIADKMTSTTSRSMSLAVKTIRNIYNNKYKPTLDTSWFFAFSGGASADILNKFPEPKGFFKPLGKLPSKLGIDGLNVGYNGTFKFIPTKKSVDIASGKTTWTGSISGKLVGKANVKGTFENTLFKNKSWWKKSNFNALYTKFHENFFNFDKGTAEENIGISVKETDKYSDRNKSVLLSLSNEFSLSFGKKISLSKFQLLKKWKKLDASAAYTKTASWKMTSGGTWVQYLRQLALKNNETADNVNAAYPIFKSEYLMTPPSLLYDVMRKDNLQKLAKVSVANPGQYSIKDVLKIQHANSSELSMDMEIPIMSWIPGLSFQLGASVGVTCYPSESYLSIEDNEFLPVVLRPSDTILDVAEKAVSDIAHDIDAALKEDREKLDNEWARLSPKVGVGSAVGEPVYFTNANTVGAKPAHQSLYMADGSMAHWVKKHHPQLAKAQQKDICTFGFTINDQTQNFNAGINLGFEHFYPAGELLACTNQGDTLFVVSEVCDLSALQGESALVKSQNGKFKMETSIGIDDLTPFGFPKDLALDIYHANPGSEIWEYVGPAGQTMMVDGMGAYIMATPIANDIQAPELDARIYDEVGYIRLVIKENIGLRLNSMQIFVNGTVRTPISIDEWNYIIPLTEDDQKTMITFYASIIDLAGNNGHVFRLFHMEREENPTAIEQSEAADTSSATIAVTDGSIVVSGCKPNVRVALFAVDGQTVAEGRTDGTGRLELSRSGIKGGVYIVALSNGTTKKIYLK